MCNLLWLGKNPGQKVIISINIGQALSLISEIIPDICSGIHEVLTSDFITTGTKCECWKSLFETFLLKR